MTHSDPELCFILVPNSKELEGYSLEKILKPVNHPSLDLMTWECIHYKNHFSRTKLVLDRGKSEFTEVVGKVQGHLQEQSTRTEMSAFTWLYK